MWKLLLGSFLSSFVNETLAGKVGTTIFNGKGLITQSGPDGTSLELSLGTITKYKITVTKIASKY